MSKQKKQSLIATLLIILLIVIDQIIKVVVKLNMNLGESIHIFDWFQIQFIENNGMAWGMELGSKLFLSIFRIVAIGFLIWYISNRIKHGARMAYIVVLSMITAGAAGNIFDSLFYGQLFTASTPYYIEGATPATLVSWGEGYAPVLMGKVVDMFYFPLFHGTFPDWFPLWVVSHSPSSHQYSTLQTPASLWVSLRLSLLFERISTVGYQLRTRRLLIKKTLLIISR